jgi:hypothetical protein
VLDDVLLCGEVEDLEDPYRTLDLEVAHDEYRRILLLVGQLGHVADVLVVEEVGQPRPVALPRQLVEGLPEPQRPDLIAHVPDFPLN